MSKEIFLENNGIVSRHISPVHGGDINNAWRISTTDGKAYFLKENDAAAYPGMMRLEAEGLSALSSVSGLCTPGIIAEAVFAGRQFLLLQWLETTYSTSHSWQRFGRDLAMMHRKPQPCFGWDKNNFIGSLVQLNTQKDNWPAFYCECRIMPLADKLYQQNLFTKADLAATQKLCLKIHTIFPAEPASLLHGDLWSGNFLFTTGGKAAVYDPAVYFGHREMDIAMSKLFGGFDTAFYQAYQDTYPLENGWQDRLQLAQLYPVMVHAVLFGGSYVPQAISIIKQYG